MEHRRLRGERLTRLLFVAVGTISAGLAYVGLLLPVVPQSPFLLIAIVCYSRGSKNLESWLLNNRLFGRYLENVRENGFLRKRIGEISRNRRLWGVIVVKTSVLAIILFHILGVTGIVITFLVVAGKLALFGVAIYISERIWSVPITENDG